MNYLIGIDGGGTKTLLRAADSGTLALLGEAKGGASNLTALPEKEVQGNLDGLLADFFAQSGLSPDGCCGAVLGSAGAGSPDARGRLQGMLAALLPKSRILVEDDALPVLYAGTETGVGMILISGTGSICLGRNEAGKRFRAGGWGHLIGDEGSGYALGRDVLTAVMEQFDGRGPKTMLTEMVFDRLGLQEPMEIIDWTYRRGNGKSEIAALSALCEKAALAGDQTALAIFNKAAYELARMAMAVAKKLPGKHRICVCSGGNLTKAPLLREKLAAKLGGVQLVLSERDAADGCLLMAREMMGRGPQEG